MSENKYKVIPVRDIIKETTLKVDQRLDHEVLEELINQVYSKYKVEGYKFHSVTGAGLLYVIFEKVEDEFLKNISTRIKELQDQEGLNGFIMGQLEQIRFDVYCHVNKLK